MCPFTIRHVGPTPATFPGSRLGLMQSPTGRILSLARAAGSARLYAGTFAGLWRSDDAGRTWRQLTRPQPDGVDVEVAGALFAPHVLDLAVSPADPDLVLASGSAGEFADDRDGLYRSVDGGNTWGRVLRVMSGELVSQIVFAPDDATLVFAAIGPRGVAVSRNAGATWSVVSVGAGAAWHVAVAAQESKGKRLVYAAGDNRIFVSVDGGNQWQSDRGAAGVRSALDEIWNRYLRIPPEPPPTFARPTAPNSASGPQVLAIEPGNPRRLYLATPTGANGPGYYDPKVSPDGTIRNVPPASGAGEASLWYGDFDAFETTGAAQWSQLPGPALYHGVTTPSGNAFVVAKPTSSGYLLFLSDLSHVHVAAGKPTATSSWHRLDGLDVSAAALAGIKTNTISVHPDPHALVVTEDFDITLKPPSKVRFPYDQNSVLDQFLGGTIWMANDGGVVWSEDGGQNWKPATGLETLDLVNMAGLYGVGSQPALYIGVVDNDDFCSFDGGTRWKDGARNPGDADAWFSDVAQRTRVLEFSPHDNSVDVITSAPPSSAYPDATDPSRFGSAPPPTASNASSRFVVDGFRPIIQTLSGEAPLADGDYVFSGTRGDGSRVVFRTRAISSITAAADWEDPAKAEQVGPPVPSPAATIIQVGGGHASPVFYLSDGPGGGQLWKLDEPAQRWQRIAPGGPPGLAPDSARRFFVHPYDPQIVYLLDRSSISVSVNGGRSWAPDASLTRVMTADGLLSPTLSVLRDMVFVRDEPSTCFALGNVGVAMTTDGILWRIILSSAALPGRPESAFFDPVSDRSDRALYVACEGRGVLRMSPIPVAERRIPPSLGPFELAAILADA